MFSRDREVISILNPKAQHWRIGRRNLVLSRIDNPTEHTGFEVLAFPADRNGKITSSTEVWGRRYKNAFPSFEDVAREVERFFY
jgi:hypothetical protein